MLKNMKKNKWFKSGKNLETDNESKKHTLRNKKYGETCATA